MNGKVPLLFGFKMGILGINLLPLLLTRPFPIPPRQSASNAFGVEKALGLRARHVGGLGRSLSYIVAVIDPRNRKLSSSRLVVQVNPTAEKHLSQPGFQEGNTSTISTVIPSPSPHEVVLVNSYELTRLGYLVFGDKYLITFDEWDLLSPMAPLRSFWNHRVVVWTLRPARPDGDAELAGGRSLESTEPQLWRLNDPRLLHIRWWRISACSIQC